MSVWSVELFCIPCDFSINVVGELVQIRRFFGSNGIPVCPYCGFKLIQGPGEKVSGHGPGQGGPAAGDLAEVRGGPGPDGKKGRCRNWHGKRKGLT